VAEILGESPGALLAALEEALSAHFLVATPDGLAFQHEVVRQAVAQTLPESVQQALHWQCGQMLLVRGGSAVPAAYHLLNGARPGDACTLAGLDRAVAELLPFAPGVAAELATGALVLTPPSDPGRPARTVTTAKALTAAGQWDEAETLVRSALAVPLPSTDSAALRTALSYLLSLTGRATEAMAEAQNVLANFEITADVRDDTTIALLRAWLEMRDNEQVDQLARAILAQPSTKPAEVIIAATSALALVMWDAGKLTEALDLAAQAVRKATEERCESPAFNPRLLLAARLVDVRRIDEATAIVKSIKSAETIGANPRLQVYADVLHARIALAAGRLDDAAAQAESVLGTANASGPLVRGSFALPLLAIIALRQGDLHAAAEYADRLSATGYYYGSAYLTGRVRLVEAQVLEARDGPRAALDLLADVLTDLPEHRSMLVSDPANAPWLVRAALAAGDRNQAESVVSVICQTAQGNPTLTVVRDSAEHAEGLLASDISRLQDAAARHLDPWARSNAAEDYGVLLATAGRDREAISSLDEALREYTRLGAKRDIARTRSRLRQLGVRRRHWGKERRPVAGWESLTDTERATARLVAQGLTNQQVADQVYISTHTVAFHLRQVFRKLDIRSRVELARIALEHDQPDEQGPA
jgi:DNA-binding CsgD family transcriptional regulator